MGAGHPPHCPSVLLANLLKGTSTEKMRPLNMTWTPSSGMLTYILMPTWETAMPSFWKPGLTTSPLKMIWMVTSEEQNERVRGGGDQPVPGALSPPGTCGGRPAACPPRWSSPRGRPGGSA